MDPWLKNISRFSDVVSQKKKELEGLKLRKAQFEKEFDYNNFQHKELEEAGFKENELEKAGCGIKNAQQFRRDQGCLIKSLL